MAVTANLEDQQDARINVVLTDDGEDPMPLRLTFSEARLGPGGYSVELRIESPDSRVRVARACRNGDSARLRIRVNER